MGSAPGASPEFQTGGTTFTKQQLNKYFNKIFENFETFQKFLLKFKKSLGIFEKILLIFLNFFVIK